MEKREHFYIVSGNKIGTAIIEKSMAVPLKIEHSYTLTMRKQKEKLRKQFPSPLQ